MEINYSPKKKKEDTHLIPRKRNESFAYIPAEKNSISSLRINKKMSVLVLRKLVYDKNIPLSNAQIYFGVSSIRVL